MKIKSLMLAVLFTLLGACSSSPSSTSDSGSSEVDGLSFSDALEVSVDSQIESDSEKKQIMDVYTKLGGAEASLNRANDACQTLAEGQDIEKLSYDTDRMKERYQPFGFDFPGNDRELEIAGFVDTLYISEVYTAQAILCPETKTELDF